MPPQMRSYNGANDTTGTTERRNNRHHHGRESAKLADSGRFPHFNICLSLVSMTHPTLCPLSPSSMMLV